MSSNKRRAAAVCGLAAICLAFAACAGPTAQREAELATEAFRGASPSRDVYTVGFDAISETAQVNARVEFVNFTVVRFDVFAGYEMPDALLTAVHVRLGQHVEAGAPMMEITMDRESVQALLSVVQMEINRVGQAAARRSAETAEAQHAFAVRIAEEANADRQEIIRLEQQIYERKAAAETRRYREELAELTARKSMYEAALEPLVIAAPAAGQVSELPRRAIGDMIELGAPLALLADGSLYRVLITANTRNFRFGMPVALTNRDKEVLIGRVVSDPTRAVGGSTTMNMAVYTEAKLATPETYYRLGASVTSQAMWVNGALCVPSNFLHREEGKRFVYVINDGVVGKRYVKTGAYNRNLTQILYGVQEGDTLVEK